VVAGRNCAARAKTRVGTGHALTQCVMTFRFDENYRETATLRDGSRVSLRLVRPSDKELLRRGFERLSPESRYRRFLAAKTELRDAELAYLTEVDGQDHFAVGATTIADDGTEEGVGIARFIRAPEDPRAAEAAIAVVDDWQRRGLGTLLLSRLAAAARERGIERFGGRALAANEAICGILEQLGSSVRVRTENRELVVDVDLPEVPPDLPAAEPTKTPLQRILALVAGGVLRVRRLLVGGER
jgi:GNAT superfamily N-acetyltransferase